MCAKIGCSLPELNLTLFWPKFLQWINWMNSWRKEMYASVLRNILNITKTEQLLWNLFNFPRIFVSLHLGSKFYRYHRKIYRTWKRGLFDKNHKTIKITLNSWIAEIMNVFFINTWKELFEDISFINTAKRNHHFMLWIGGNETNKKSFRLNVSKSTLFSLYEFIFIMNGKYNMWKTSQQNIQ